MVEEASYRDQLYTIRTDGSRKWVYPALQHSGWRLYRRWVAYVLMVIYVATPWVTVRGKQAVWFNLVDREFVIFGQTFWATDTYLLGLILVGLALLLFFFTAIAGRIWCGWACPETVFLEFLFRPIETLIEGGPAERLRLDRAPWGWGKLRKKALKALTFGLIAWMLASTAVVYFVGAKPWLTMILGSPSQNLTPFLMTVFMMLFLSFQFGWFREQFCTVLCPYARFQSVLLDSQSLLVGYDRERGEPRGKLGKVEGDCVDCGLCVRVCPTGIDIRNGLQLECIQCAACADACDSIMQKVGRATGLVRYDTEVGLAGGVRRFLRPRVVAYALILLGIGTGLALVTLQRSVVDFHIVRGARDEPYARVSESIISNHLHLEIGNKGEQSLSLIVRVNHSGEIDLITPINPFMVKAGEFKVVPLFFKFPEKLLEGGRFEVEVELQTEAGEIFRQTVTLLGPG